MSRFDEIFARGVSGGVISGSRKGFNPEAAKIRLRPFDSAEGTLYQLTYLLPDRAAHENLSPSDAAAKVESLLRDDGYAQAVLFAPDADHHATYYGKLKISKKPPTHADSRPASHDKPKPRLLDDADPSDYLKALGIMSENGHILGAMKDKYRQIERYLELSTPFIPPAECIHIADFGCGKSYLTFALYHYITTVLRRECVITGIDLKADVIASCTAAAEKLGYVNLRFVAGDAAQVCPERVDMVVTLHACDVATDYALAWAVSKGAQSIVSAPCCQHELFGQLNASKSPLLRGVLRERTAALLTDAVRAQLLEAHGYNTEVVEFIDSEHTPKNIMLRARLTLKHDRQRRAAALESYRRLAAEWGISPKLAELLS